MGKLKYKTEKICIVCGGKFLSARDYQKKCSELCRKEYYKTWINNRRIEKQPYNFGTSKCLVCKSLFNKKTANHKFCSNLCLKKTGDISWLVKNKWYGKNIKNSWLRLRIQTFDRFGFKCCYCGRNPIEHNTVLHVDHVNPLKLGGKNSTDNLVVACSECNLGKGDYILSQWHNEKKNRI